MRPGPSVTRVGVISDTHGVLRPEALAALAGSQRIVHAGDVGSAEVLEALARIAPVESIRGNNDRGPWARDLPDTRLVEIGGVRLHLVHALADLELDPAAEGVHAVISGHSHKPSIETRGSVLYVNPGSAGPRRFTLPVAVARLEIRRGKVTAEIVTLNI